MDHREPQQPRVLSHVPGRLRLHVPGWHGERAAELETGIRQLAGVAAVQANALTGNVLIYFDARATDASTLIAALTPLARTQCPEPAAAPLLRAGLRGLLGHAVVDSLWFGAGFLGKSAGLPLAGLGPLHVLLDLCVWGAALASAGPRAEAVR
jgi:hypothetical protein